MTCRCTPQEQCLNCLYKAKSRAFIQGQDEREAIARGRARWAIRRGAA